VAEQNRTAVTLRAIAAWLESHPDAVANNVTLDPYTGSAVRDYGVTDAADLADRARRIGGRWTKQADDYGLFKLRQEIVPGVFYELVANREDVCERVQVGEEAVTEPDPVAVEALPKVERMVPVYEWRCEPILAHSASSEAA
jgi:hypothetical protein